VLKRFIAVAAVALWSAAVVAGIQRIWSYESTPGEQLSVPATWPDSSLVRVDRERATVMMFVHPLCSCTRASLIELREALDVMDRSPAVWVVLLSPQGIVKDWNEHIAAIALRIPEATIVTDVEGKAANRFGASTSGHVVVYDHAGKLMFSGGITEGRGHVGDNRARRDLISALRGGDDHAHEHPIFGCGLDDPEPRQQGSLENNNPAPLCKTSGALTSSWPRDWIRNDAPRIASSCGCCSRSGRSRSSWQCIFRHGPGKGRSQPYTFTCTSRCCSAA
jgi:hypothetical protein